MSEQAPMSTAEKRMVIQKKMILLLLKRLAPDIKEVKELVLKYEDAFRDGVKTAQDKEDLSALFSPPYREHWLKVSFPVAASREQHRDLTLEELDQIIDHICLVGRS